MRPHLGKADEVVELLEGQAYLVFCHFVDLNQHAIDQTGQWHTERSYMILPVYPHPHDDPESGQPFAHYHTDRRWEPLEGSSVSLWPAPLPLRLNVEEGQQFDYFLMRYRSVDWLGTTPVELVLTLPESERIGNSKICKYPANHRCLHKGYNLVAETEDANGLIMCPLHGVKYIKGL